MKLPIGIEDFAELRTKNYYFIDKSLFIKDLIDKAPKVLLITRPRRFGKTLLMSMVKHFFSLEEKGVYTNLFAGLNIEKANTKYLNEQGSNPVVMLSLKDCKATSWENMQEKLKHNLSSLYQQYSFLLDDSCFSETDCRYFNDILNERAKQVALENALQQLLQMLRQHYKKPVVLLIDEYDVPIQQSWEHGFYTEAITFMRNFLSSALKTNPALDFALLTGVLRIAKESIFSGLNNIVISSVIEASYPTALGFTENEVNNLAVTLNYSDKLLEIKQWYDGYNFAGIEIYNPWSVLNYFYNNFRGIYSREVLRQISGGASSSVLTRLMRNLLSGNTNLFQQDLQSIILQMTSVYDTANKESFYHGFLLGMTALLVPQYEVQSNRESGEGRFDLAIFPKNSSRFGVILEFKTASTAEELSERANEALEQIENKSYIQSFLSRNISQDHILKYGIAFCGKNVKITTYR